MESLLSQIKAVRPNKRVEADAVRQRTVSCNRGGRAAHAQRYVLKTPRQIEEAIS